MADIRLNKLTKQFNVGLGTLAEFLNSLGANVEENPNAKVSDEYLAELEKKFGDDKKASEEAVRAEERMSMIIGEHSDEQNETSGPVNEQRENSLSSNPSYETTSLQVNEVYTPIRRKRTQDRQMRPRKTESLTSLTPKTKVVGKIDPSKLQTNERTSYYVNKGTAPKKVIYNKNNITKIKDVWQRYIDIQEKLIRQRSLPILIDTESIQIEDDKLYVTVDESNNIQQIESILKGELGADDYDLNSGFIMVDENKWSQLSEEDLSRIRKSLSSNYIELNTTPSINVSIDYSNGLGKSDNLTLEELQQLDFILKERNLIEGSIDDKATFISTVSIQRETMLRYLFGDHFQKREKKKREKGVETVKEEETIEYHNKYIPWDVYLQYQNTIGLKCESYKIIFTVNNEEAFHKLLFSFENLKPSSKAKSYYEYTKRYTKDSPIEKDFLYEVNATISQFMNEASMYCSLNDIDVEVIFSYSVKNHTLAKMQLHELALELAGRENYSFNEETGAIGIDFNWREDDIKAILAELEARFPFIKVNIHEDHRYKCRVNTAIVGYEKIKKTLEEEYQDIDVLNDSVNHKILISLPYVEKEHYDILSSDLRKTLRQVSVTGIKVNFAHKEEGKVRLSIKYNAKSRREDMEEAISDMRNIDFGFMRGEQEIRFGRLIKVSYPKLIFDIDIEEDKKEPILTALESKAVNTIIPILTGDLEKISRLKNTFTMATTGRELVNPRLQNFMFDSSLACKIDEIELLTRKDGKVYLELSLHLLNPNINESQKEAIIKAMFAEDLAVIQGPPGTGKSTAIAELIWQLVRNGFKQGNPRERILLTSETNLAVDNAISRVINNKTNLVKPIRFGGEEKLEAEGLQFSIDLMKRWVEEGDTCLNIDESDEETDANGEVNLILKNWLSNISRRAFYGSEDNNEIMTKWRAFLDHPNKELRKIIYDRYMESVNVIGATCSSIGDRKASNDSFAKYTSFFHNYCEVFKQNKRKSKIEFTTVIQDESSKATPAELILPFVYGKRAIVIGDHRQLPPMLDKEEFEDTLDYAQEFAKSKEDKDEIAQLRTFVEQHFDEMEISHFERLYKDIDPSLKGTFNLQYRMHPDINEVIEQFYQEDGGLDCGLTHPMDLGVNDVDMSNPASRYHGIKVDGLIDPNTHVLFINTTSPEMLDGKSRVNYGEVETINRLLDKLGKSETFQEYLSKFSKEEDKQIGIISFYGKQIKQLRNVAFAHRNIPTRVSTVDRFQGMERNIVIVSMVRSNKAQSTKGQKPDRKRYPKYGYPEQRSLGFAQSPNRLNVALSRAKRLLVIVGNEEHFSKLDIYKRLFSTIRSNQNNIIVNQEEV